ncbi:conserved hypothetical protein [Lodderomyces elongisporus NRRL YB-4239]|uniref:DAGKc domain-containing protein n=1 Tax=Lodderomyces elongisporus (strain ATCC 11503 / CBS 2605 / JCM 1781 / NBRC 1676 / NRRL YB-4239) TaxID=379508 RepID=A5E3H4_LODEL|nr:conserved hypothetical protein [Lodderomyces elongisporus NRRL YB-4239]
MSLSSYTSSFQIFIKSKSIRIELAESESIYYFNHDEHISPNKSENESDLIIDTPPNFLTTNKVYILDSVSSGTGRSKQKDFHELVLAPLLHALGVEFTYIKTTSPDSIENFAHSLPHKDSFVFFLSGDTSVNEFINKLNQNPEKNNSVVLFPIPMGTGNSFALSLGITNPLKSLVQLLAATAKPAPLNLYNVLLPHGSYKLVQNEKSPLPSNSLQFLVVFSWAFHASLVADSDTPELRKHGLERFKMAAENNLKRPQIYNGETTLYKENESEENEENEENVGKESDEKERRQTGKYKEISIPGPYAYWLVTPAQKFEPTFEISPNGNILDDSLYLVAFKSKPKDDNYIMDIMMQVYDNGKHTLNPDVQYTKIERKDYLKLSIGGASDTLQRRFCIDGAILVVPEKLEIVIKSTGNHFHGWELQTIQI